MALVGVAVGGSYLIPHRSGRSSVIPEASVADPDLAGREVGARVAPDLPRTGPTEYEAHWFFVEGTVGSRTRLHLDEIDGIVYSEDPEIASEQNAWLTFDELRGVFTVAVDSASPHSDPGYETPGDAVMRQAEGSVTLTVGLEEDPQGELHQDVRVTGFLTPEEFLEIAVGGRYRFLVRSDNWFPEQPTYYIISVERL